jgi:hypothetical protein
MIKYEYIADKLYEAGLKPGYIADYLCLRLQKRQGQGFNGKV